MKTVSFLKIKTIIIDFVRHLATLYANKTTKTNHFSKLCHLVISPTFFSLEKSDLISFVTSFTLFITCTILACVISATPIAFKWSAISRVLQPSKDNLKIKALRDFFCFFMLFEKLSLNLNNMIIHIFQDFTHSCKI